ncbi:MAG: hypothetical protein JST26_10595 [Bacteroidetes bacterium]|nr:hypothetical protein [Bacteroidota bacterium]
MNIDFKKRVIEACRKAIGLRIERAHQAMLASQESANNEDKSSAGDKYETARAMGQADRDMNARQLQEALNEQKILDAIRVDELFSVVGPGALVELDATWFFVAIGLGPLSVDGVTVIVLSASSPLYQQLRLKKKGDEVIFRNKPSRITALY